MKCPKCSTEMVLMITSSFCPNDCDREQTKSQQTSDGEDTVTLYYFKRGYLNYKDASYTCVPSNGGAENQFWLEKKNPTPYTDNPVLEFVIRKEDLVSKDGSNSWNTDMPVKAGSVPVSVVELTA